MSGNHCPFYFFQYSVGGCNLIAFYTCHEFVNSTVERVGYLAVKSAVCTLPPAAPLPPLLTAVIESDPRSTVMTIVFCRCGFVE